MAFPLRKARGRGSVECDAGITERVRLGREPGKRWRGLYGRKPGCCTTVIPMRDNGQSIGHDRVPTVFWGSKEPGAGKGSLRTVPRALILMGDWCVPEVHDNHATENLGAYHGQ